MVGRQRYNEQQQWQQWDQCCTLNVKVATVELRTVGPELVGPNRAVVTVPVRWHPSNPSRECECVQPTARRVHNRCVEDTFYSSLVVEQSY